MMDLSIIIVSYNNCKLLKECLASIYRSIRKITFEIIVGDNGSDDGSGEMVRAGFPDINLIANKDNLGFVKANNQGLKIFKGRYALLLNDDTVVKDGALDKMIGFMDMNPAAGAGSPKLLNIDGTVQHQGGLLTKKFWNSRSPVAIDFAIGACLMVRRETVEKVGMLDEKLFFYNEDLDWCIRIRKAGYKIYFIPDAEVVHYGGHSSKRAFNRRLFAEGFRGGIYFCRKHYGKLVCLAYKTALFMGVLAYLPLFILSYPFKRERFNDRLLACLDILELSILG